MKIVNTILKKKRNLDIVKDILLTNTCQNGSWYGRKYHVEWGHECHYTLRDESGSIISSSEKILESITSFKEVIKNLGYNSYTQRVFKFLDSIKLSENLNLMLEEALEFLSSIKEDIIASVFTEAKDTLTAYMAGKNNSIYNTGDNSDIIIIGKEHSFSLPDLIEENRVVVYYSPDPNEFYSLGYF